MSAKAKIIWFIILLSGILISGCETVKGIVEGVPKDVKNTWRSLTEADDWMKKNLW